MDENKWDRIKNRLPSSHMWECSFAKKKGRRGRAKGGFIIGVRKKWGNTGEKLIKEEVKGIISTELIVKGRKTRIISVYGEQGGKKLKEKLERMIKGNETEDLIIGGDFNIRIGELGRSEMRLRVKDVVRIK